MRRTSPGGTASTSVPRARSAAPVRVMHVMYTLRPGGMEFGVVKLVAGLPRTSVQSMICSTTPASAEMTTRVPPDVPVVELQRRPGHDPRVVKDLYRLFRQQRPDVVHTHAWGTLIEGMLAARLARVPIVVHGEHGTLQLRGYQRRLQRFAWSGADQVLSVSSRLAERMTLETGFHADRIQTIRNGVDIGRFAASSRADARASLNIPDGAMVVGTVGRLVPVKNQRSLLEAMARLRASGLRTTVLIAGDGPLRPDLESAAAALGLGADVRMLGHCPRVETVLAAMDVFVLPSISEGLSNTILEAMAAGRPVVATHVGGADELVVPGDTGLLVPPGSIDHLAEAIGGLLENDAARRSMGEAARHRAATEFSLASMIERYEALYRRLVRPAHR